MKKVLLFITIIKNNYQDTFIVTLKNLSKIDFWVKICKFSNRCENYAKYIYIVNICQSLQTAGTAYLVDKSKK